MLAILGPLKSHHEDREKLKEVDLVGVGSTSQPAGNGRHTPIATLKFLRREDRRYILLQISGKDCKKLLKELSEAVDGAQAIADQHKPKRRQRKT